LNNNNPSNFEHRNNVQNSSLNKVWEKWYFSGNEPGLHIPVAIVSDSLGNVFVTGYSTMINGTTFFTMKYDIQGNEAWTSYYNGPIAGDHIPTVMKLDAWGNVFVAGKSTSDKYFDWVLVKYDPDGKELWTNRYDGSGGRDDVPNALVIDNSGNAVVMGTCTNNNFEKDIVTIKFGLDGALIWCKINANQNTTNANVVSGVIDNDDNVYVAINVTDQKRWGKVIKYNSQGDKCWERTMVPAPDIEIVALTISKRGRLFIAENYCGYRNPVIRQFDLNGYLQKEFMPIQESDQLINYLPCSLVCDNNDNLIISGVHWNANLYQDEYLTIKYFADGSIPWFKYFSVIDSYNNYPTDLSVDQEGDVYVAGFSGLKNEIIKYSAGGDELWLADLEPGSQPRLTIDQSGDLIVTESIGKDSPGEMQTSKYTKDGTMKWHDEFGGGSRSTDQLQDMAIGKDGSIYLTSTSSNNIVTMKYSNKGDLLWKQTYDGSFHGDDWPYSLALDANDDVYVLSSVERGEWNYDYTIIKYSTSGNEEWVARQPLPDNCIDGTERRSLVLDKDNNVYFTGWDLSSDTTSDIITAKYNQNGIVQWVAQFGINSKSNLVSSNLGVDSSGNVYVIGQSDYSALVIKYNSKGTELWNNIFQSEGFTLSQPELIEIGSDKSIYIAGFVGDWGSINMLVDKLDSEGHVLWAKHFDELSTGYAQATGLIISDQDHPIVTGYASDDPQNQIILETAQFDGFGSLCWTANYKVEGNANLAKIDISKEANGNLCVGLSRTNILNDINSDIIIIEYDSLGQQQWVEEYEAPNHKIAAQRIIANNEGEIVAGGTSYGSGWSGLFLFKYSRSTVFVASRPERNIEEFTLKQNYPNPFNPITTISYQLPKDSIVELIILNLVGERIRTLVDGMNLAGSHEVMWDGRDEWDRLVPSGIYWVKMKAEKYEKVLKMLLLK